MTYNVIGQLILGWLLADFITGVLHHFYDRIWWPPFLALANGDHHARPLIFVEAPFVVRTGPSLVTSIVILAIAVLTKEFSAFFVTFCAGIAFWNEIHRWAHAPRLAPGWVRVLQEMGFFQSPRGHSYHHTPTNAAGFCLLSNWVNPVLDSLGLWGRLEKLVGK